jgi:flagellar hook-associated protein 1 FlgK
VYDKQGNEVARREINIDINTVVDSEDSGATPPYTGNSIVSQINRPDIDDNSDNDSTNDVDDYFEAFFMDDENNGGVLTIQETAEFRGLGYTVAVEDHGTNFPGTFGLNQFFTGKNAKNIDIASGIKDDPDSISPSKAPVDGNNELANDMVQLQYDQVEFKSPYGDISTDTLNGYYRFMTTDIGSTGESYINAHETSKALYEAVYQEHQSISGVSVDEELAQLIKYQTGYGASAKVITTVDQMLNTLLGIKQ